nr:S41 family peptidase [uncultured Bacteroides sp.]
MNKIKDRLPILLLLTVLLIGNASCKDDDNDDSPEVIIDPTEEGGVSAWIESTMREHYLWYADMPAQSKLNFKATPEAFFSSLLSTNDGDEDSNGKHYYYSYIESTAPITKAISNLEQSYGFEFNLYPIGDSHYAAHLLYVAPNTPADEAKLKRGDWIVKMNTDFITISNYKKLYGSNAMELTTAKYINGGLVTQAGKTQLGAARKIEDDPVHYHDIIPWNGKKVGYLVYNHFTAGQTDKDTKYDKELLTLSNTFRGVDEFVLDLRYNNGGLLTCAQLLSTILAPADALGKIFCTLQYNDKQRRKSDAFTFDPSILNGGINLNLKRIFILVTAESASASELVINCLKPYMEVVVIGETTEGKNVGSVSYTDDKYPWHLQPIVCKLYNASGKSEYGKVGFIPDYKRDEAETLDKFLPFGDTNELLLSTALGLIGGTPTVTATKSVTRSSMNLKKIASSLDRKTSNGVIIR